MGMVRIVTDSTADIPEEVRERLGISMIPLKVLFGEETFLDAVTIKSDGFYEKLAQSATLPTTSQPSPMEFSEVYEKLLAEDAESPIISIHLSAALSGTYQSAVIAHSMLEGQADITIMDSRSASYGFGMRVVQAAEMAQAGASKERIIEAIEQRERDTQLYFLVDTLEFLQKGGRIGKASALIGSILNIKPILSLDADGVVLAVDKVRGSKKAMSRIIELLKQTYGDVPVGMTMAYSFRKDTAEELCEQIKSQFNVQEIGWTTIGAVIGTHTGPGASAVFMYRM
ncbi:DegV family protein with EDD domain [Paenibacillus endophyticus]|uniref:DegV family protein with EDD domain n=1 Tax=Paenibacillus endophyticus TaxID=1294268 RepID=A0A7W5C6P7_9BACL|nr:DegV family protein [Paenibacillus endophyticus]MBB3152207.1 DegV family protein with EDD domain [Paenibacillus endophyticus]